jgi:Leucine-rich repeat (LRR) protein
MNCQSLITLKLRKNPVDILPDSSFLKLNLVARIVSLEIFDLSECPKFVGIPPTATTFKKLQILRLDSTRIEVFPWSLESWTALEELYIGNNQRIQEIPGNCIN